MTKFKCSQCGNEAEFNPKLQACPKCQKPISEEQLLTLTDSTELAASIETSAYDATIDLKQPAVKPDPESIGDTGSKTAMAADMGYSEIAGFMKTLDRGKTTRDSVGRSSAIPARTLGDEKSGDALSDYKLEELIGQGSFGSVYRALQVPLERYVAIKLLKPLPLAANTEGDQSKVARISAESKIQNEFLREAQFTGKLEHPNIVPIHDIGIVSGGEKSDRPFYVMKEIKGISWQDVLAEKSRDQNIDIFQNVVDAIGFSHSRNILHCDLKPENVMLGEFGEVLLVDWGQAIDMTDPETFRPGGTPAYCSPEMAQYWCDFGNDPEKAESSKKLLKPAADVYLLGAILFQIVTGKPPHFGLKGETAAQVMMRAAKNQIRRYDEFANDELLQIALRALRLSEKPEINTVAQLNEELASYDNRKQSIDLRDRAFDLLESARQTHNYDTYQKAKFGFEESLELWQENPTARDGLQQTRLSCAELALKDQNFDLGLGMLDKTDTEAEVRVKDRLLVGKRRRDRRKRLILFLGVGFATAVAAGLGLTTYFGNKAIKQTEIAKVAKDDAIQAKKEAEAERVKAEVATKQSAVAIELAKTAETREADALAKAAEATVAVTEATKLAEEQKMLANQQVEAANRIKDQIETELKPQIVSLEKQKTEAEKAKAAAQVAERSARQAALAAEDASRLLRYKTQITTIKQKADLKDFRTTRELLDAQPDQTTFEWGRLNLLAHPEVTTISRFPNEPLMGARLSGDRETLALCFDDRIEICSSVEPKKVLKTIPMSGVQNIALSHDGKQLAIGKSGGAIQIVDTTNGRELLSQPLTAQSTKITDMEFTRAGNRLLAAGIPDRINSSVRREHALMLWESKGSNWEPMPTPKFKGAWPYLSQATFSADGNRIVTSNPEGRAVDRVAFVLELNNGAYEWIGPSDVSESGRRRTKAGFMTSIFVDPAGEQVLSSYVAQDSADLTTSQIVVWNVMETPPTVPVSLRQVSMTTVPKNPLKEDGKYPQFEPGKSFAVDAVVNSLDYNDEILLATQEKEMIYWKLPNGDLKGLQQKPDTYGGHGHAVQISKILNAGSKFITIATGADPEILLTNTNDYRAEEKTLRLADRQISDGSSPSAFFADPASGHVMIGSDEGLVSINSVNDGQMAEIPEFKWHTSAWEKHVPTRQHLFALSKRDDLYRYDLVTGELETIFTKLSEVADNDLGSSGISNRISSLDISADSRFAVLQRNNDKQEFEIWNLQNQTRKVVAFGDKPGLEKVDVLPLLTLSDDGQWIAGGRVRFYVWQNDGTLVGDAGVENNVKKSLNCLRFFGGSSQLAVGSKGLLRTYQVEPQLKMMESYPISMLTDNLGKPNIVAAQNIDQKSYALIESVTSNDSDVLESGLSLIELKSDGKFESVQTLTGAQHGSLSATGQLVAVTLNQRKPLLQYDLRTDKRSERPMVVSPRDVSGEKSDQRNIFSRIYFTQGTDLVLQWSTNNRQNSVAVTQDGRLSNLCVIATPTVGSVGLAKNRAATFENGKVRFWKLDFEKQTVKADGTMAGNVEIFELAPNGKAAFASMAGGTSVGLVDFESGQFTTKLTLDLPSEISAAGWSKDGSKLAIGFVNGAVGLLQNEKFSPIEISLPTQAIVQLRFSSDGNSIVVVQQSGASGQADNVESAATVLRRSSGEEGRAAEWYAVRLAHPDGDAIVSADISGDGKRVVTGSKRGRVTIWNSDSQAGSADRDSSERELMGLTRFASEVRTVRFGDQESSVVAFEKDPKENLGIVFPVAR